MTGCGGRFGTDAKCLLVSVNRIHLTIIIVFHSVPEEHELPCSGGRVRWGGGYLGNLISALQYGFSLNFSFIWAYQRVCLWRSESGANICFRWRFCRHEGNMRRSPTALTTGSCLGHEVRELF